MQGTLVCIQGRREREDMLSLPALPAPGFSIAYSSVTNGQIPFKFSSNKLNAMIFF